MSTDNFIKVLSRQKHEKFLKQLHLIDITHLINQKKRSIWTSKCQIEKVCWKKSNKWSDIMINWNDEMNWWDNVSKTSQRIFISRRNLFDQMIWSFDLINRILSHYIIIQFFIHERFDHKSHLFIWDDSYRWFFINLLISRRVVLRSFSRRWFIQIEMIFFIFTDFRERREINEHENEYAILMRSDRSDNEARRQLDQKKKSRDDRRSRFSERSRWIMRWEISR
jgi:hypothetical protein